MKKNLHIAQSMDSKHMISVTPYETDTQYLFYADRPLAVNGMNIHSIACCDFDLCEFIESEILSEIERRRRVQSLGYVFENA